MKKHISQDLRSPSQYPSLGFQGKMAPLLGRAQRRHGQIATDDDAALFKKELKKSARQGEPMLMQQSLSKTWLLN